MSIFFDNSLFFLLFPQQTLVRSGQEQTETRSSDNRQNNSRNYTSELPTTAALENSLPPAYESLFQNLESAMDSAFQVDPDSPEFDPTPQPRYQDYIQNLNETVI